MPITWLDDGIIPYFIEKLKTLSNSASKYSGYLSWKNKNVPTFLAAVPHFWTIGESPPRKIGHRARPHGQIKKNTACPSSASGLGGPEEKGPFSLLTTVPRPFNDQNDHFAQLRTFSSNINGALWRVGWAGLSLQDLSAGCITRAGLGIFLKFIRAAEHCGHLYGAVTSWRAKHGEQLREKKGGQFLVAPQNTRLS